MQKYFKEYVIKSYEVDCHGFLRVLSLMNFLQDIAVENADYLGFGMEKCLQMQLAWVGSDYFVQIERLPRIHEKIVIETWPAEGKIWGAIRDFVIRDAQGQAIIKATSQWVLIDVSRRRPVMLKKHFPQYQVIAERAVEYDFPKLANPDSYDAIHEFMVRYDDIDINKHVNNAVYPVWASESVDSNFRMQNFIAEIAISFKKEALYGEKVVVETKFSENNSWHLIKDKTTNQELAQCHIKWQPLTSK